MSLVVYPDPQRWHHTRVRRDTCASPPTIHVAESIIRLLNEMITSTPPYNHQAALASACDSLRCPKLARRIRGEKDLELPAFVLDFTQHTTSCASASSSSIVEISLDGSLSPPLSPASSSPPSSDLDYDYEAQFEPEEEEEKEDERRVQIDPTPVCCSSGSSGSSGSSSSSNGTFVGVGVELGGKPGKGGLSPTKAAAAAAAFAPAPVVGSQGRWHPASNGRRRNGGQKTASDAMGPSTLEPSQ